MLYSKDINQQLQSFDAFNDNIANHQHAHESEIEDVTVDVQEDTDLTTCYQCCNDTNYCNQNLCDSPKRRLLKKGY